MDAIAEKREGGCHCGKVRYQVRGEPVLVEYCHCESCRRAVGAPLMAWAAFAGDGFEFTSASPGQYKSSDTVVRTFCDACGASLTLADERFDAEVYVAITSLDDPESTAPDFHIWRSHRLSWLETADDLPRYMQFRADGIKEG